jgi:glycosyltransferase involved in cell wall biosynthesis
VILEAMAAGKPVIATAAGGVVDIVTDGDTGLLVPPGDVEALANAIRRLIDDRALAAALAQRGARLVHASFTMQRNAAHVSTVYDSLLDGNSEDRAGTLS